MSISLINKSLLAAAVMGGLAFPFSAKAEIGDYYTVNKQEVKSSIQYRCMEREGIPATVAYTSRGAIELIRWQNDYFNASNYTPDRRCKEVSIRFQKHSDADNLRFISTGMVNNYKAICISEKTGDCKEDGLLLTLQPSDNSEEVLRSLFSLDTRRQDGGLRRSSGNNKIKEVINLNQFLEASPVVNDAELNNDKPVIENPFEGL